MARIDYYAIEKQIQTILDAAASLDGIYISEPEVLPTFDPMGRDAVYIYLVRSSAPAEIQRLRAGSSTDEMLTISIWCFSFHADLVSEASRNRNDLIGKVELALMADRTLGGTVHTSWISAVNFESMEDNGFWSGGELVLEARAQATT